MSHNAQVELRFSWAFEGTAEGVTLLFGAQGNSTANGLSHVNVLTGMVLGRASQDRKARKWVSLKRNLSWGLSR